MICGMCKKKPSTGIIFAMCDECFEDFEKKIPTDGTKYTPTDAEVATVNEPFIDRSKN